MKNKLSGEIDTALTQPLIVEIEQLLEGARNRNSFIVIGVDGMCGAGKSTLANLIADKYGCSIVHMDDFFLPADLRTPSRLNEPGGNVHYERFITDIVQPLLDLKLVFDPAFTLDYRRFDCSSMTFSDQLRQINFSPEAPLLLVEGSYTMRPEFIQLYDYTIFMSISEAAQAERIISRSGEAMYPMFRDKWIPLEQRYFKHYQIAAHVDFVFDSGVI